MPAHERLSLARCRKLLAGSSQLTDVEVLKLRDDLYDLANLVVDVHQAITEVAGSRDYGELGMSGEELVAFGDRYGYDFRNLEDIEEPDDLGYQA